MQCPKPNKQAERRGFYIYGLGLKFPSVTCVFLGGGADLSLTLFGLGVGGGGGQKVPTLTLNVNNFFNIEAITPPNLATFPKIYLATIWHDISWSKKFDISMATVF